MKKIDGFFPLYWDEAGGRLFVEIPKLDTEVLHSTGFGTGLGSNDIGIDRGALTGSRIVKFERVGPRVLMVQPNYQFRGTSDERRGSAGRARRVRALGAVGLPDCRAPAAGACSSTSPSSWCATPTTSPDGCSPGRTGSRPDRSSVYMPMTAGFPKNTEMEAELTFVRQPGGPAAAAAVAAAGGGGGGVLRGRRQRRGDRRSGEHPRAPLDRRAARRQLQAARLRSALRLLRRVVRGLRGAARRADDEAVHRAAIG